MDLVGHLRRHILNFVIAALVAAIHLEAGSGACGRMDCGDKPRNDMEPPSLGIPADFV
jgi:hypothetical protein